VEAPRERDAVLRIDDPLLTQRVRDAEAASAIELRHQASRVDDLPYVADGEIVDECHFSGLDIHFDFGKANHE